MSPITGLSPGRPHCFVTPGSLYPVDEVSQDEVALLLRQVIRSVMPSASTSPGTGTSPRDESPHCFVSVAAASSTAPEFRPYHVPDLGRQTSKSVGSSLGVEATD